jgi:acetyl-CoA acetyltransferase
MPVEGVLAVVMTTEDRAKDTPHPGGYITNMATVPLHEKRATGPVDSLEVQEAMGARMARNLYEGAGLGPNDISLKQIYDGFSPMVWMWAEAFGFAPQGEGHAWAQPETIGRNGPHPLNTSGGSLGNGRLQGFVQIHETAVQMMGTAGSRQVPNAEVALCQTGPFGNGTSIIVTKD